MEHLERSIMYQWKDIIRRAVFMLSIPLISTIYPILNRDRGNLHSVETFVDNVLPFNKYFIIPYMSWYLYVGVFLTLLCIVNKERYFKLLFSLVIGMLTCYTIYFFFPTYVPRPAIQGDDMFSSLVLILYERDNPYNCFPSIHVLNSLLVAVYIWEEKKINIVVKIISATIALAITLSTMFVKQHFFADAVSATLMAGVLYFAMRKLNLNIIKGKDTSCP